MASTFSNFTGPELTIPKRFSLVPSADGSLQVNLSAQCVGYVLPSDNSWLARDKAGTPIAMSPSPSVLDAVTAVFRSYGLTGQGFQPIR